MTKFEMVYTLLEEVEDKGSGKNAMEKIREYNKKLEGIWEDKEKQVMSYSEKNMECYSNIEECYAEPLFRLANKLGSKLIKVINKLNDADLITYSNEIESLTNSWVTKKSKYSGILIHRKKDPARGDKTFSFAQAQGGLVGGNPMMTPST
jgi:hypothetical protein